MASCHLYAAYYLKENKYFLKRYCENMCSVNVILWYFEHLWWWSNLGSALNLGAAFISLLWMHSYFSPPDLFWLIGAAPRVPTMLLRLWKHEIEATYHQNARTRKVLKNCAHWNHRHKDFPLKIWLQKHQRLIRWEQAWEHWAILRH